MRKMVSANECISISLKVHEVAVVCMDPLKALEIWQKIPWKTLENFVELLATLSYLLLIIYIRKSIYLIKLTTKSKYN